MTAVVVCKSTRFGAGCGHPVNDHIGNDSPNSECCCCTWRHNDPDHRSTCDKCGGLQ